jgi:hypothetical protein
MKSNIAASSRFVSPPGHDLQVDGHSDLRYSGEDVPRPQLVVFDVVGVYAILSTEVYQEDRHPEHLQASLGAAVFISIITRLAVAVEEGCESIDCNGITAGVY